MRDSAGLLLLATKFRVTAIRKDNGRQIWCTELPHGAFGSGSFVTLTSDLTRVFAYAGGHLSCLELASGKLLWTNELPGFGYGLASLCLPGQAAAPEGAAVSQLEAQRASSNAAASSTVVSS